MSYCQGCVDLQREVVGLRQRVAAAEQKTQEVAQADQKEYDEAIDKLECALAERDHRIAELETDAERYAFVKATCLVLHNDWLIEDDAALDRLIAARKEST